MNSPPRFSVRFLSWMFSFYDFLPSRLSVYSHTIVVVRYDNKTSGDCVYLLQPVEKEVLQSDPQQCASVWQNVRNRLHEGHIRAWRPLVGRGQVHTVPRVSWLVTQTSWSWCVGVLVCRWLSGCTAHAGRTFVSLTLFPRSQSAGERLGAESPEFVCSGLKNVWIICL